MRRRTATALLLWAIALAALPAGAEAARIGYILQVPSYIPARIDHNIGFIPLNGLDRWPAPRIRSGRHLYVGSWQNALLTRRSLSEALRHMRLIRNTTQNEGAFSDRALTRSERRRFELLADIGRDGDVLVVKAGHPACAGLTLAQARAIATGGATSWSQVVSGPTGGADRIAVRHQLWSENLVEPRFGGATKPRAGRGSRNPIGDAAADPAVAAVTSWSRARFQRSGVCAVPLDGVAPDDVAVHGLAYPGAYPIGFVVERNRPRHKLARVTLASYVKFLESEMAAKLFRRTGMLMAKDTPQTPGGTGGGGTVRMRDAQGREISPVRDDAGVTAALTGERIAIEGSGYHWAFEGGGVLRYVQPGEPCSQTEGRWTVVEGQRYSEHGGGVIARVLFELDGTSNEVFLDVPNEPPGIAYLDGTRYSRSRDLPGGC